MDRSASPNGYTLPLEAAKMVHIEQREASSIKTHLVFYRLLMLFCNKFFYS